MKCWAKPSGFLSGHAARDHQAGNSGRLRYAARDHYPLYVEQHWQSHRGLREPSVQPSHQTHFTLQRAQVCGGQAGARVISKRCVKIRDDK